MRSLTLYVLMVLASFSTITYGMSIDEMWKVIQTGDLDREKTHLPIDGSEEKNKKITIKESDILIDEQEEYEKREFNNKRQATDLPVLFSWHLSLWRTRIIPYTYSSFQFTSKNKMVIEESMREIESKVCIKFQPKRSGDTQWIDFYMGTGCFSSIGRKYYSTAATRISLGNGCINKPIIIHELLHALGYYHEQSRIDRDSYVQTYMYNVNGAMKSNFDKNAVGEVNTEGTAYDSKSIMQYGRTAFTANGQKTMESKFDPNMPLGSSDLSPTDIVELNRHYHCDVTSGWTSWSEYSPCIQQAWGQYHCTRARVKICMGTSNCDGADEYGTKSEVQNCKTDPQLYATCSRPAVDGVWSNWGDFTKCYSGSDCGIGVRSRTRSCSNPAPSNGGKGCVGSFLDRVLCRNKKCQGYSSPVDSTFSNGLGDWKSSDFVQRVGSGPYTNVGPNEGVIGSEPYAAFTKSPGSVYGIKMGKMTSPQIDAHSTGQKRCFVFHYQLNGRNFPTPSTLSVYLQYDKADGNGKEYVNSFAVSGHQGNFWHRKAITINERNRPYEIVIEGRVSSAQDNEVAVDDFFLGNGECPAYWNNDDGIDLRADCSRYSNGHCYGSSHTLWMIKYCPSTCSECKDRDASCNKWANEKECITNPSWMLLNCCQSCHNECSTGQGDLCYDNVDYVAQCPKWAEDGECIKNSDWMSNNCYKSCYNVIRNL